MTYPPALDVEALAQLMSAADVHVNHGNYPTWETLSTEPGYGRDEYRKAARYVLARTTVTARQTTGQDDTDCPACGDTGACNGGPCAHPEAAPWTTDGRHGPTPDEMRQAIAHAIHRYDNQHALSGNDIPTKHHYGEADAVLAVLAAPAVGQPAEAQDADRAALRERLRLAIAQQYLDDTGSGRTVDDLDDTEFGSLADAALRALTVEDER